MGPQIHRLARFVISGGASTLVAYAVVIGLLRIGAHYSLAVAASWPAAMLTGFALNRRFTFGIRGAEKRGRDLGLFVVGSLLQLGLAIAGFGFLTEGLGLGPSLAFLVNIALTTAFSFGFQSLVTFRRAH
jgi:putative flippase GtrA